MILIMVIMTSCKKYNSISSPKNVVASVSGNQLTLTWDKVKYAEQYCIFKKMEGYLTTNGEFVEMMDSPTTEVYYEVLSSSGVTTYTYQVVAENKREISSDPGTSNSVTY